MVKDSRPEPEALLAEAAKEGRGRLKVFLGAAPGVGKTFSMLEAARERQRAGTDVAVGVVETHGRAETERLLEGLDVLSRAHIPYAGRLLPEMDLDAILKCRPGLVLVDELAHTNVPGSRHPKRWQDVEELLEAGIDVYTTLNIQHLESLNDIVARISRVRVRETVPDKVLELADEIELIDLPPEELIERLRAGKVYVQEQMARAIQNFFSKGNLTALRELAMRVAADRVDAQMTAHMKTHAIPGPWPTQERVLVCVNEAPVAKALVRAAKRIAERARAEWIAARVVTPPSEQLSEKAKDSIAETLRLAESLGAEIATINAEAQIADEILDFARERNVSRIVIGRPRPRRFAARFFRETVAEEVIRKAGDFEVTILSCDPEEARRNPVRPPRLAPEWQPEAYLWSAAVVALATAASVLFNRIFPVESLSLFFLVGVLFVATRFGLWPSLFASALSFVSYNFFLTQPYYTLRVVRESDILTLLLFLAVAIATGNLAARLRAQVKAQRAIAKRTANLFEFSRKVASVVSLDDVVWAAVHHVASTLNCDSLILMTDKKDRLAIVGGYPPEDRLEPRDWGAADWAWQKGEPAGWNSQTLPSAAWYFLPMKTAETQHGLLGVRFARSQYMTPEERRLLDALVDQVAIAIERTQLAADMEETRLLSETESLRAALLSSVSHDLRTPLVSIIGAASSLVASDAAIGADGRRILAETIRDEGERLNRYIQNLLDMTRLGYGGLKVARQPVGLGETVARAVRRIGRALGAHRVETDIAPDLPDISGDPILIEQVITNILDNAAKYAPPDTAIAVTARAEDGMIDVTIDDEGPGIPAADRTKIFDMFYRAKAGDRQAAGTGLGLAICKGIVEAHGGRIRIGARPGGPGTRVSIRLPAYAIAGEPANKDAE